MTPKKLKGGGSAYLDGPSLFRLLFVLLLGVVAGAFTIAFLSAGEIYEYHDSFDGGRLPKVDAIVCLAGGRGRITAASDLWYRYWEKQNGQLPLLYFSGVGPKTNWAKLKPQIRRGVLKVLTEKQVLIENESTNTIENAEYFVEHAKQRGWSRILIVTSGYHMKRSLLIFHNILGKEFPIHIESASVFQTPFAPGEWRYNIAGVYVTVVEYLKWLEAKNYWRRVEL